MSICADGRGADSVRTSSSLVGMAACAISGGMMGFALGVLVTVWL